MHYYWAKFVSVVAFVSTRIVLLIIRGSRLIMGISTNRQSAQVATYTEGAHNVLLILKNGR